MSEVGFTMRRWRYVYRVVVLLLLTAAGGLIAASLTAKPCGTESTPSLVRRAPDRDLEAQLLTNCNGVAELWLVAPDRRAFKVSHLGSGEAVRDNFAWSPDGDLLAFESYNADGHSPLTTSRAWVVQALGDGLAEVSLPAPNERFSTHLHRWRDDNTLEIRADLLAEDSVLYEFTYDNRQLRPNLNHTNR